MDHCQRILAGGGGAHQSVRRERFRRERRVQQDPGFLPALCHRHVHIEIVCQIFYAGMFSYNTLATGSGHTMFIMWNSFLNCIVVRLILALILDHLFGVVGVYVACGVAVASSVPVGYWFYRSRRWMHPLNVK